VLAMWNLRLMLPERVNWFITCEYKLKPGLHFQRLVKIRKEDTLSEPRVSNLYSGNLVYTLKSHNVFLFHVELYFNISHFRNTGAIYGEGTHHAKLSMEHTVTLPKIIEHARRSGFDSRQGRGIFLFTTVPIPVL
jgi:hypothetical protein